MGSNTTNLNLYKGTPGSTVETFNVQTMLNDNWDKIDTEVPKKASALEDGRMSKEDKSKLDGIEAGANNYQHPATHSPAVIVQDVNNRFVTDAEKAAWNAKETTGHASKHANGGSDPITPANIGALSAAGGTLTGALTLPAIYLGDTQIYIYPSGDKGFTVRVGDGSTYPYKYFEFDRTGDILIGSNKVYHQGNDGTGSGLDADTLDGQQGSYYLPASNYNASDVLTKIKTVDGAGSGLDADKFQGKIPNDFFQFNQTSADRFFAATASDATVQTESGDTNYVTINTTSFTTIKTYELKKNAIDEAYKRVRFELRGGCSGSCGNEAYYEIYKNAVLVASGIYTGTNIVWEETVDLINNAVNTTTVINTYVVKAKMYDSSQSSLFRVYWNIYKSIAYPLIFEG